VHGAGRAHHGREVQVHPRLTPGLQRLVSSSEAKFGDLLSKVDTELTLG
jgi:hypothetical protein